MCLCMSACLVCVYLVCVCVGVHGVCMQIHMLKHICGSQRKPLWSWFSPFIFMWNIGTELTLWSFHMNYFAHWSIFMNPLPYCWEYGLSLSLELADSAIPGSWLSPKTLLSFCLPIMKDYKCTWLLLDSTGVLGSNCRSLCLHCQVFFWLSLLSSSYIWVLNLHKFYCFWSWK